MEEKKFFTDLLKPINIDIDRALELFSQAYKKGENNSFDTFTKVWNDMNLHLIYVGQITEESFMFQDLLLDSIKSRLFPPYDIVCNIGAAYLLYSFITMVPNQKLSHIQIRVTLEDLKKIKELIRSLKTQGENDSISMLLNVLKNHTSIVAHPMSQLKSSLLRSESAIKNMVENDQNIKDFMEARSMTKVTPTLQIYNQESLESRGSMQNMVETNHQYYELIQKIAELDPNLTPMLGPNLIHDLTHVKPIRDNSTTSIGDKRQSIKFKSFKTKKSERKCYSELFRKNCDMLNKKNNFPYIDNHALKIPTLGSYYISPKVPRGPNQVSKAVRKNVIFTRKRKYADGDIIPKRASYVNSEDESEDEVEDNYEYKIEEYFKEPKDEFLIDNEIVEREKNNKYLVELFKNGIFENMKDGEHVPKIPSNVKSEDVVGDCLEPSTIKKEVQWENTESETSNK